MSVVVAACLALAAVVVIWPTAGRRARLRRVLGAAPVPALRVSRRAAPDYRSGALPRPSVPSMPLMPDPPVPPREEPRTRGRGPARPEWLARLGLPGWAPPALLVTGGAALGAALGGPVAGLVVGAYGTLAARLAVRRRAAQVRTRRRVELLDLLGAAAADLRAGLPTDSALATLHDGRDGDPLRSRVEAAVRLAERTGAPLADVIERIEADARSTDRARASSSAQAAGSRATAWLLAGLPVGGIALGYAIGTDPLAVLLHTPIGAACAVGAVILQLGGLAWAGRIARSGSVGTTAAGSAVTT